MSAAGSAVQEADLWSYLRILWRRKWLILLVTVLGGVAAAGFADQQTRQYRATADTLLQSGSPAASILSPSGGPADLTPADVATQIQVATSAPVQQAVAAKLHEPAPPVGVSEIGQTNVIQIAATNPDPAVAAKVANAYANAYVDFRRNQDVNAALSAESALQAQLNSVQAQIASLQAAASSSGTNSGISTTTTTSPQLSSLYAQQTTLQSQLSQLQASTSLQTGAVELITPASVPKVPSSPDIKRTGIIGLVVGLILGAGGVLLAEAVDDRIRNQEELAQAAPGIPLLGMVPAVPGKRPQGEPLLPSIAAPSSLAAEAYRQLRTSLQFLDVDREWKLVQVTSPVQGEGKTTTVTNLAIMLAEAGRRTLLVDADLRRPQLHEYFGLQPGSGLTNVLLGEVTLEDAVQKVKDLPQLRLLASGPIPPNPAELITGDAMGRLLAELRSANAEAVLFDTPPVLPVADALALAPRVDATLVVVQAGRTRAKGLGQALERLEQVNAHVSGLVLNALRRQRTAGYAYGYYYPYGYSYRSAAPQQAPGNGSRTPGAVPSPHFDG
jgi:capsular exopolysaccharide synthesis family protein